MAECKALPGSAVKGLKHKEVVVKLTNTLYVASPKTLVRRLSRYRRSYFSAIY